MEKNQIEFSSYVKRNTVSDNRRLHHCAESFDIQSTYPRHSTNTSKAIIVNGKPRPLLRSVSSYTLNTDAEKSPRRIPTLFLGKSEALPDPQHVFRKLCRSGISEESPEDESIPFCEQKDGKSVCVVFNLEELAEGDPKTMNTSDNSQKRTADGANNYDKQNAVKRKISCPFLSPSSTVADNTLPQRTVINKLKEEGSDGKVGTRKFKPPLKRSMSEFSMNAPPKHLTDSMEAFRAKFLLHNEASNNSSSVPAKVTENVLRREKFAESKVLKTLKGKQKQSKSVDDSFSFNEHDPRGEESFEESDELKSVRRKRRSYIKENEELSDQSEDDFGAWNRRRRYLKSKNKFKRDFENAVDDSFNSCLPQLQKLITSEVQKQVSQLNHNDKQLSADKAAESIYRSVFIQILDKIHESLDIEDLPIVDNSSGIGSSVDNLADRELPRDPLGEHSASLWDLSSHPSSTNRKKLAPSLSFADLGLSDELLITSASYKERAVKKQPIRAKSFDFLDCADVEVEGDLNHLPLEHHLQLKTALMPLCREMNETIQGLNIDSANDNDAKTVASLPAPKPKSLLLKLHVDLDKLDGNKESDGNPMEWDYYDQSADREDNN